MTTQIQKMNAWRSYIWRAIGVTGGCRLYSRAASAMPGTARAAASILAWRLTLDSLRTVRPSIASHVRLEILPAPALPGAAPAPLCPHADEIEVSCSRPATIALRGRTGNERTLPPPAQLPFAARA